MTAQTFLQELQRLILTHPKRPAQIINSEGCEYGNYLYHSKNLYYCFDCVEDTDCLYSSETLQSANCIDCDYTFSSQLCYECVGAYQCFNCLYLENCSGVRDSAFLVNCGGCHDIFGCVNLQNKSFCIFNRQLSETEYREKIIHYMRWPAQKVLSVVGELKKRYPVSQTHGEHNENSPFVDYIFYSKNCYSCFDTEKNENCGYLYNTSDNKYSYDVVESARNELAYEVTDSADLYNCSFVVFSAKCVESSYLFDCFDVKNSLGCVMLGHRQHCILNRQFTEEEYQRLSVPILRDLRQQNVGWDGLVF